MSNNSRCRQSMASVSSSHLHDVRTSPIAPLTVFLDFDEGFAQELLIFKIVLDEQNFEDSRLRHLE